MSQAFVAPSPNACEINWVITDSLDELKHWQDVLPFGSTYDFQTIFAGNLQPEFAAMEEERIWREHILLRRLRVRSHTNDTFVTLVTPEQKAALLEWFATPKGTGTLSEMRELQARSPLAKLFQDHKIPEKSSFVFSNSVFLFDRKLTPLRLSNNDKWLALLNLHYQKTGYTWELKP